MNAYSCALMLRGPSPEPWLGCKRSTGSGPTEHPKAKAPGCSGKSRHPGWQAAEFTTDQEGLGLSLRGERLGQKDAKTAMHSCITLRREKRSRITCSHLISESIDAKKMKMIFTRSYRSPDTA